MTEIKEESRHSSLYPNIINTNPDPSAPVAIIEMQDSGQSFRLTKISDVQKFLEEEIRDRGRLEKKFLKYSNVSDGIEAGLGIATLGLGGGGLALLSTIVAIPVTLALEACALVSGLAAVSFKFFTRRTRTKAEKHGEIKHLATSKLNTVNSHISQAINDNKISHEEFTLIMEELEKYKELKNEVRTKTNKKKKEQEKNDLIERGKREAREEFRRLVERNQPASQPF